MVTPNFLFGYQGHLDIICSYQLFNFVFIIKGARYIEVIDSPFYYEWYLAYNRQSKK